MVGVDSASEVRRQMEIQQRGIRAGTHDGALFFLGFGARQLYADKGHLSGFGADLIRA